ncbi:MAG: transposase [Spirochaetales bacterium]|nr:transposase [Spirochaetales bacterium]
MDFIAELTQHVPSNGVHLIRCYGLYTSRTKGCWINSATIMPYLKRHFVSG